MNIRLTAAAVTSAAALAIAPSASAVAQTPHAASPRSESSILYEAWGGYVDQADTNVTLRYVASNFVVPNVNCDNTPNLAASFWVGLDGSPKADSGTVEQVGVQVVCTGSAGDVVPSYGAFWESYPNPPEPISVVPISAGDSIAVSVYYDGTNYDYSILDNNNRQSATLDEPCGTSKCNRTSAEAVVESGNEGMPDFGTVTFTGSAVTSHDGTHGTFENNSLWKAVPSDIIDTSDQLMAAPGVSDAGGTVSVTWWNYT